MIISSRIAGFTSALSGNFEFASLIKRCELILRKEAAICDKEDDSISLKNGKYRLEDGVLFIKATRIYWKYLPYYCEREDCWSTKDIFILKDEFLESLETPPQAKIKVIKRWWRKDIKIKIIEFKEDDPRWYKAKEEFPFEIAIHNFRLNESNLAKK